MPIGLIYNVKISAKQKFGLVCVFGLCFVMIAFAIIRAKQVLVPQYFVNLTMLMVWSTLAASVCESTAAAQHATSALQLLTTPPPSSCHRREPSRAQNPAGQPRLSQAFALRFLHWWKWPTRTRKADRQQRRATQQRSAAEFLLERQEVHSRSRTTRDGGLPGGDTPERPSQ